VALLCLAVLPQLANAAESGKPFKVVTTFTVIRDIARKRRAATPATTNFHNRGLT